MTNMTSLLSYSKIHISSEIYVVVSVDNWLTKKKQTNQESIVSILLLLKRPLLNKVNGQKN